MTAEMTFQKAFVVKKLTELNGYLDEVEHFFSSSSDSEIVGDSGKLHIAERLLQLVVDTILDINQHFIRELALKGMEDFQGTFYIMAESGILPKAFARRLAPVVGLRNRIVRRYDTLDKKLFVRTFRKNYRDFLEYVRLVGQCLEKMD